MRDPQSFDEFYRGSALRTLRYAVAIVRDRAEAQDAVQEAYTRAWQRWETLASHPYPEAWVRLTVTRLATDRWRRLTGLWAAIARTDRSTGIAAPPSENTVLLVTALRQLPARQRQVLALHYLVDLTVDEIAAEVGIASGTVKSLLSRGRDRLAAQLGDLAPDRPLEVHDA
ncbi:SigE family RNA polymerase sigma factor [Micromonospora sp. NBC_01796]|uniref:SigE family RNA polymerase sigma factor n=1 Tax=Micromonospora sp. NBC_01796 TaxID=2975987 RepID=UPI002DDA727F|nr:SigE family RNA polymerase sigma factor [Micromonospora sp. NBC_01796]WSA88622.1 SigE family RNA polymerase sigma factor [Micromonospora sp. NBC_01796]